jgi:LCP family protein required for cell wall assembly
MSKGNTHNDFDFGNDSEFQEKLNMNIEKALSDDFDADMLEDDNMADVEVTDAFGNEPTDEEAVSPAESESEELFEDNPYNDENEETSYEESTAALDKASNTEGLDETLEDINNSLAKQIGEELENIETGEKKKSRMMKIQIGVIAGIVFLLGTAFFLGFTKPGNNLLIKMGINIGGKVWEVVTKDFNEEPDVVIDEDYIEDDDLISEAVEVDTDTIIWPDHSGYGRHEEGVYNILLLGEEAINSGNSRGRTDLIIIATLNKKNKSIKLTSFMRDTLVQIPGYKENRLNSSYEKGDVDLLYETIALNFNLHLDGCVLVNFENFEKIIDYLGGIELTLTSSEARYLRNTNYISNPNYRTVVEGTQLMNGNQVLGYSRIRKRTAITGKSSDYGRTDRHRIVLNAIFEKYKTKNELELVSMMFKMLPMVRTDIDSKTFEKLITTFIEMGTMEIEQLRIPVDGSFTDNVKVRNMEVLILDLEKNVSVLHEFIFGS